MTKNIGNKKHSSRMRTNHFSTTSTRCQHQWVAGTRGRVPVQWGPMPGGDARTRAGESVYSKAENITFLQLRWRVAKMQPEPRNLLINFQTLWNFDSKIHLPQLKVVRLNITTECSNRGFTNSQQYKNGKIANFVLAVPKRPMYLD